jgi:hypothetical protein
MNDPYPSEAILRAEAAADLLVIEHDRNVQLFRDATIKYAATIAPLIYPLGSPCRDYEPADIDTTLLEWLIQPDPRKTEGEAWEIALAKAEGVV